MSTTIIRILVLLFWAGVLAWWLWPREGPVTEPAPAGASADGAPLYWFKGNTHAHAKIRLGEWTHGDATPEQVVRWYREHGYHFLSITDHNIWSDGSAPTGADGNQADFLVLAGMEVTSDHRYPGVIQEGERKIHSTALGGNAPVDWQFQDPRPSAVIRAQSERIKSTGGLIILNHPNYRFQLTPQDVIEAGDVKLFELFNDHPRSNHDGHAGFRLSMEAFWDEVLSAGHLMYGVAADDAHDFGWLGKALRKFGTAPPGGAWIMVRAPSLSREDLFSALEGGDFYASTGVYLKDIGFRDGAYSIEVDMERTRSETKWPWIEDSAPIIWSDDSHFVVEFFGRNGRLLHWTHDQATASFRPDASEGYVRGKVTYLSKLPSRTGADWARAYYAWTQPVMLDSGRSAE